MKNTFKIFYILLATLLISCSTDSTQEKPTYSYSEVTSHTQDGLKFIIKSKHKDLIADTTTPIILEITDEQDANNNAFTNTEMSILMHMTMPNGHKMNHAAPISQLTPVVGQTNTFKGEIMFTMPGNEPGLNYWTLTITTYNKGKKITATIDLLVKEKTMRDRKSLHKFRYEEEQYIMAMHEISPINVGDNNINISVFKSTNNGMDFPIVKDFKITIDPRMPDMGNHGVGRIIPPLYFNEHTKKYQGIIPFNMTGYWYINLFVTTSSGDIIAGKIVAPDSKDNSDAYFEVEF